MLWTSQWHGGKSQLPLAQTCIFNRLSDTRRRFLPLVKFILSVHPKYEPQGINVINIHKHLLKHDPERYGRRFKTNRGVLLEAVLQEGVLSVPKGTDETDAQSIAAVTLVPGSEYVLDTK